MSDTKFTPGPWREGRSFEAIVADADTGHDDEKTLAAYGGHLVCESVRSDANRALILAAPDLYAALLVAELASEELCQGQDPANECWVTLATIRSALAKAQGEA